MKVTRAAMLVSLAAILPVVVTGCSGDTRDKEHDDHCHHDRAGAHYWLDPANMATLAEAVGRELDELADDADSGEPLPVAATVFPLADLVSRIGGDRVTVTCITPPGASPHAFELNPRNRRALAAARLVIYAGPTDQWFDKSLVGPDARVICLAELVVGHDHDHDHDAGGHDVDGPFAAKGDDYAARCEALAAEMKTQAAGFKHKTFVAEHPAYETMAEAMGLKQVASVQPVVGAARTPRHLRALIEQVVDERIPVIYTEPQLTGDDARTIQSAAAERGWVVKVLVLDPIGSPSVPGRRTYLENMRTNLAALKEGLGG